MPKRCEVDQAFAGLELLILLKMMGAWKRNVWGQKRSLHPGALLLPPVPVWICWDACPVPHFPLYPFGWSPSMLGSCWVRPLLGTHHPIGCLVGLHLLPLQLWALTLCNFWRIHVFVLLFHPQILLGSGIVLPDWLSSASSSLSKILSDGCVPLSVWR